MITLGIIGVVAALVIPMVTANVDKTQNYSKMNKAFSTLSQAAASILSDNGGDMSGAVKTNPSTNAVGNENEWMGLFKDKIKYSAYYSCDDTSSYYNVGYWKTIGGITSLYTRESASIFSMEGFVYLFDSQYDNNCGSGYYKRNGVSEACGVVWVDTNGTKAPNTLGKDVFIFLINKYNVVPFVSTACDKNNTTDTTNGVGCATRAIAAGKIDYY